MLKVFSGEDTFTSYHAAKAAATEVANSNGWELEVVDGDNVELEHFKGLLFQEGLFSSGKVIFLKRPFANKKLIELVANNTLWQKAAVVVWEEGKLDNRLTIVKELRAQKKLKEYQPMQVWELTAYVHKRLSERLSGNDGKKLAESLAGRVGNDLWQLEAEVSKIELYLEANKDKIDNEEFDQLITKNAEANVWSFLDAIALGKKRDAIYELQNLMANNISDQYIVAMLARELSLLSKVLYAQARGVSLSTLKLHSFVLDKTVKKARNFTLEKVNKLTLALLRLDIASKQGRLDIQDALFMYLLSW